MLRACRRVLRSTGSLAFFVIHQSPGAEAHPYFSAPPGDFTVAGRPYRDMLHDAGFIDVVHRDVTEDYRATVGRWIGAAAELEAELTTVLGFEIFSSRMASRWASQAALADGALRRSFFVATPAG